MNGIPQTNHNIAYTRTSLMVGQYGVDLYVPDAASSLIVYLHAASDEGAAVWQLLPKPRPMLAIISGTDWNRDFSPWPAEKIFPRGEDFAGGAEKYLASLTENILPAVENALSVRPVFRCIAGYSLAGLFAIWSTYRCDMFDYAAALSPSLWYDGFIGFMAGNRPSKRLKRVSLSLGDREKRTRNRRMAAVQDALETAGTLLDACSVKKHYRSEHGGHFDDIPGRIARGIAALYSPGRM